MKAEAAPFWALPVAGLLGVVYYLGHFSYHRFDEPEPRQFCQPDVKEGMRRMGYVAAFLEPADVQQFDLVSFRTARSQGVTTSRVVAVEGQRVRLEDGRVFVDGQELREAHANNLSPDDFYPEVVVPEACVFVLNDQRWRKAGTDARDSRNLGPIPIRALTLRFAAREPAQGAGRRRR